MLELLYPKLSEGMRKRKQGFLSTLQTCKCPEFFYGASAPVKAQVDNDHMEQVSIMAHYLELDQARYTGFDKGPVRYQEKHLNCITEDVYLFSRSISFKSALTQRNLVCQYKVK